VIGSTISHYRITEKLGEGGMGVVYKAEDLTLGRTVALKFLPSHAARSDEAKARFLREARAAAALDHPNICTVHEVGEADEQPFIAMAYIDGVELANEIENGPLEANRLIDIAAQVSQGLQEAHDRGVVHRDIKPANIMVTPRGQAVLMDFGLAQLDSAASKLTREGTTLGTSAYMSPEQTEGGIVDHRTDIWALGVVMYEMATGELPFRGHYEQAVLYSILNEPPEPMANVRAGTSEQLERVVNKCLEKRSQKRYQAVAHVLRDLRSISGNAELGAKRQLSGKKDARPSVAVLPFENRSRDEGDEYLSDGITEDIINALTKVQEVRVAARSSAFHFKGKNAPLEEVAEKLRVGSVVEGTVRRAGDRLRITAQLVDASEGYQVWSERYDRVMEDIFDVQDEISLAIVDQLKVKLIGERRLVERPTESDEAYQLYLQGRLLTYRHTGESIRKGLGLLQRATKLDPHFVQAHAVESFAYLLLTAMGWMPAKEGFEKAKSIAAKTMEMNDCIGEVQMYYGLTLMVWDRDWARAEDALRQAVKISPEDPHAHSWLAELFIHTQRFPEALVEARRAYDIDPLSGETNRKVASCELCLRQYDNCIRSCRRLLDIDEQNLIGHWCLGLALVMADRADEALQAFREACDTLGYDPLVQSGLGYVLGRNGQHDEAREIVDEFRIRKERGLPFSSFIGLVFLGLGENDAALDAFEDAIAQREGIVTYLLASPLSDAIRSEERFDSLMERLNLAD
jgi:serine/threonine-protein kinase